MNLCAEIFFSSLEDVFKLCSDCLKDKESAQHVYVWFSTFNVSAFSSVRALFQYEGSGEYILIFPNMPKNSSQESPKVWIYS